MKNKKLFQIITIIIVVLLIISSLLFLRWLTFSPIGISAPKIEGKIEKYGNDYLITIIDISSISGRTVEIDYSLINKNSQEILKDNNGEIKGRVFSIYERDFRFKDMNGNYIYNLTYHDNDNNSELSKNDTFVIRGVKNNGIGNIGQKFILKFIPTNERVFSADIVDDLPLSNVSLTAYNFSNSFKEINYSTNISFQIDKNDVVFSSYKGMIYQNMSFGITLFNNFTENINLKMIFKVKNQTIKTIENFSINSFERKREIIFYEPTNSGLYNFEIFIQNKNNLNEYCVAKAEMIVEVYSII